MIAFYIILWNDAIVLHSGLVQEVCGIGFLKQGIVPQYYVEGNHEAIIPKDIFLDRKSVV